MVGTSCRRIGVASVCPEVIDSGQPWGIVAFVAWGSFLWLTVCFTVTLLSICKDLGMRSIDCLDPPPRKVTILKGFCFCYEAFLS